MTWNFNSTLKTPHNGPSKTLALCRKQWNGSSFCTLIEFRFRTPLIGFKFDTLPETNCTRAFLQLISPFAWASRLTNGGLGSLVVGKKDTRSYSVLLVVLLISSAKLNLYTGQRFTRSEGSNRSFHVLHDGNDFWELGGFSRAKEMRLPQTICPYFPKMP